MATRLANEIRPTHLPIYCSACHNQDSTLQHVDFDAAVDRGWYGEEGHIAMDDLILCEKCLREGAEHVGMRNFVEHEAHVEHLERQLGIEEDRRGKAENYSDRMEDLISNRREKPIHIDHRKKPRQRAEETNGE